MFWHMLLFLVFFIFSVVLNFVQKNKNFSSALFVVLFILIFLSMSLSLSYIGKPINPYEYNFIIPWTYNPFDNGEILVKEWESQDNKKFLYKFSIIENISNEPYVLSKTKHEEIFLLSERIDSTYSYYINDQFVPISKEQKEKIIKMRYNTKQTMLYLTEEKIKTKGFINTGDLYHLSQ